MSVLVDLLDAQLLIAGIPILWREIVGNLFGLASAIGGMRRQVWAWPVGIVGNALLLTVFLGGVFHTPQNLDLYGQAGRQVMFLAVSVYGWWTWSMGKRRARALGLDYAGQEAVVPKWASWRARIGLVVAMLVGTAALSVLFRALGSWGPVADAWIFMGSLLATFGMARGWTEFWLLWVAVDIVGVPLLLTAGYYPSAVLYIVYAGFVIWGFIVWWRVGRRFHAARELAPDPSPGNAA